ncbi:uncharacterized protein LOC113341859 [Papaver somniferum]|uniref:uncharacterized protein LOC113341859 n=1 Tax=Papaver somniferum TaxID=3469 RepID=UPI000E6F6125|nr:uncharacterized protein LOC113341859 [Papaver somniferum]
MEKSGNHASSSSPPTTSAYDLAMSIARSLGHQELGKLKDVVQAKIDWRQREIERQKRKEDNAFKFATWKEKRMRCGSATETESYEDEGNEYYIEEIDSRQEDSDTAEEKRRMVKYEEDRLYRRYLQENANPAIFSRTMHEGESYDDDEELLEDESDASAESDASESSDDGYGPPASSGSEYNNASDEEDEWSYDGEDY